MSGSATDTTIANMALSHCGRKQIDSIDDTSKEALACKQFFETAKNVMLEDTGWGFSGKRVSLAEAVGVDMTGYDEYSYAYTYPGDCLIAHRIHNASSSAASDKIPFILGTNAASNQIYIFTDTEDAILVYTSATDSYTTMRASTFQLAFSYLLAALIGPRLKVERQTTQDNFTNYFAFSSMSQTKDANEQHEEPDKSDHYINAMK